MFTRACALFGITHPVVLAPMGGATDARLAAASGPLRAPPPAEGVGGGGSPTLTLCCVTNYLGM